MRSPSTRRAPQAAASFEPGIVTIHIRARIGFRIAQRLSFRQYALERSAAPFHLRQDKVAGAVQNTGQRATIAVTRNAFAQHQRMNRDAAADARLHGEIDPRLDGQVPDIRARQRHQFLVRRDDGFAVRHSRVDNLARRGGPAHQFGHDIDLGMRHHLAPVRRAKDFAKSVGKGLPGYRAAANRGYPEFEAQFQGNLFGVCRQNREGTGADIAEPDNSHSDCTKGTIHAFGIIAK